MGFFLEKKCLFSGVSGRLVDKGSPISNVELHRKVEYREKLYEDSVITDEDGYFSFDSMWARPLVDDIDQFVVHQYITAMVDEKEILVWRGGKLEPQEFSEVGYKVEDAICDVNNEAKAMKSSVKTNGIVISICTFN